MEIKIGHEWPKINILSKIFLPNPLSGPARNKISFLIFWTPTIANLLQ